MIIKVEGSQLKNYENYDLVDTEDKSKMQLETKDKETLNEIKGKFTHRKSNNDKSTNDQDTKIHPINKNAWYLIECKR